MVFNDATIIEELSRATLSSLRENQGGVEFLQANGEWKSLISHYNASFFAGLFVENNFDEPGNYLLYGVGDGQIILEIIERDLPGDFYILETNMDILRFAHESFQIVTHVEGISNIHFCGSAQMETVKSFLQYIPQDLSVRYYYPEISAISAEFAFLTEWLNNRMIDMNSGEKFNDVVEYNVKINSEKKLPDFLKLFKMAFTNLPCLILMAGPSLREAVPYIQEMQNSCFILSVGRNGTFCTENGIRPHLWVELDSQERPELWSRLKGNDTTAPLVIMDSTSYLVHENFEGAIAMVRSKMDADDEYALPTGKSTVAAFALELAIEIGLGPIALIGQDLCYQDGRSHINATEGESGIHITANTPKILCNDGKERYSSKEFIRHRESLQKVLRSHSSICFTTANCGAKIEGASYLPLSNLSGLAKISIDIENINAILKRGLSGEKL